MRDKTDTLKVVITSRGAIETLGTVGPLLEPFNMKVSNIITELAKPEGSRPIIKLASNNELLKLESLRKQYTVHGIKKIEVKAEEKAAAEVLKKESQNNNNNRYEKKNKYNKNDEVKKEEITEDTNKSEQY